MICKIINNQMMKSKKINKWKKIIINCKLNNKMERRKKTNYKIIMCFNLIALNVKIQIMEN